MLSVVQPLGSKKLGLRLTLAAWSEWVLCTRAAVLFAELSFAAEQWLQPEALWGLPVLVKSWQRELLERMHLASPEAQVVQGFLPDEAPKVTRRPEVSAEP